MRRLRSLLVGTALIIIACVALYQRLDREATLSERLAAWDSVSTTDARSYIAENRLRCPARQSLVSQILLNTSCALKCPQKFPSLQEHKDAWNQSLNDATFVTRYRHAIVDALLRADTQFHGEKGTKGIILTAHDHDSWQSARSVAQRLRHDFQCQQPIEIWSFGDEEPDTDVQEMLADLNVSLHSTAADRKPDGTLRDYSIKIRAMIESSLQEVLLLDADCFPLLDPFARSGIMNAPSYQNTGLMFWPNVWELSPEMPIWQIVGRHCRQEYMLDSGVLAIDKARHVDLLQLALSLATRRGDWRKYFYGDCDTFRFAALALRRDYAVPARHVGLVSWSGRPWCGHSFLQHDHLGRPAFLHAIGIKHLKDVLANSRANNTFFGLVKSIDGTSVKKALSAQAFYDMRTVQTNRPIYYIQEDGFCVDIEYHSRVTTLSWASVGINVEFEGLFWQNQLL